MGKSNKTKKKENDNEAILRIRVSMAGNGRTYKQQELYGLTLNSWS